MTRKFPSMFTRPGRHLACASSCWLPLHRPAETTPKNTVFKSDAGDAWTVSIKPATRVAEGGCPCRCPVPDPVDVTQAVAGAPPSRQDFLRLR